MMLMHNGRYNDNQLPAGPMAYDDEKDDFPADLRIYGAIWYICMMFTIMMKIISKLVQWAEAVLVERDIRVWNSKRWKTKTIKLFSKIRSKMDEAVMISIHSPLPALLGNNWWCVQGRAGTGWRLKVIKLIFSNLPPVSALSIFHHQSLPTRADNVPHLYTGTRTALSGWLRTSYL